LSSSSLEMASASTSRSFRSAKLLTDITRLLNEPLWKQLE
jgi:hypothetical protein